MALVPWSGASALLCALLLCAAAAAGFQDATEAKSDVPVWQLEQLKAEPAPAAAGQARPEAPGAAATLPPDETTTKVFHGAARLVQAGAGAGAPPPGAPPPPPALPPAPPAHSAARRALNADVHRESQHNNDHLSGYGGVQYSPLDVAEYVLWTGDERAVAAAVEALLRDGLMSKEEAIAFLQEIKLYLEYLRAQPAGAGARAAAEPPAGPPEVAEWAALAARRWEQSNALAPFPAPLPPPAPRARRRHYDADTANLLGEEPAGAAAEAARGEGSQRARLADALAAQRALEQLAYHLAKMLFEQAAAAAAAGEGGAGAGGAGGAGGAAASARHLLATLEQQAQRARLARGLQHQLLDIINAALSDTLGDHPEFLQVRESYDIPAYRLMRDLVEGGAGGASAPARLGRPFAK